MWQELRKENPETQEILIGDILANEQIVPSVWCVEFGMPGY